MERVPHKYVTGKHRKNVLLKILADYLNKSSYLELEPFDTYKDFVSIKYDIESKLIKRYQNVTKKIENSNVSFTSRYCDCCGKLYELYDNFCVHCGNERK